MSKHMTFRKVVLIGIIIIGVPAVFSAAQASDQNGVASSDFVSVPTEEAFTALEARVTALEALMAPSTTSTTEAPTTSTTEAPTTSTTPPAVGFPNASNTGPSGPLAPSGSIWTSADGQVIENLDISGTVFVQHDNVTIRNVRIQSFGKAIDHWNSGLVVEDCLLDGLGNDTGDAAIGDIGYTIRRCEIVGHAEGPRSNGDVVIEDNFIHDFAEPTSEAHQDAIQITSNGRTVIRHNTVTIDTDGANAALMIGSYPGDDVLIEGNLFRGGGYTVYCGWPDYSNSRLVGNAFAMRTNPDGSYNTADGQPGSGWHGEWVNCEPSLVSGNYWHDGPNAGQPI